MSKPKVSVLMPVYKTKEEYLCEAIESILNQTFTDFEFLILDDCPEDDREAIVRSYHDPRIKYSKNKKNLGISQSRNKLIDLARGEYLAVFDHDDISLPQRLEKEVRYLDEHPEIGVVSALNTNVPKGNIPKKPKFDEDIRLALMDHCCISHSATMVRKSVLAENNIRYEEQFSPAEDFGLYCRLVGKTKFHNLQEVLIDYRQYECNTSKLQAEKMTSATWKIRAMNRVSYPELCAEYLSRATFTSKIRLFGVIPLLKITKKSEKAKIYLFDVIPLISIKNKTA
jgi:glycosyltransferase involved in cell wall biosynthesis